MGTPPYEDNKMFKIFNRGAQVNGLRVVNNTAQNVGHFMTTATTSGTTAVDLFGTGGAPKNLTITGVWLISKDTTAGNITLEKANGDDISVIAKGTAAGTVIGEDGTLANTTIGEGTRVQIKSSSSGNAQVFVTYTFDPQ